MARVCVLIVSWNRRADLLQLLDDLEHQTRRADETIVVDNGSTDGTSEGVVREYPAVRLLRLEHNTGLSNGRNVGIAASAADNVLILDNDLRIPDPSFLEKVEQSLERHPDCGVISFYCVIGKHAPPSSDDPGTVLSFAELEAMARTGRAPVPPCAYYDWFLWSTACVVRRSVFELVGMFDPSFKYGGEEWDFAYRCHNAGIRLLQDKSVWAIHMRSREMRAPNSHYLLFRGMVIAQARYMPLADLCLFMLIQFSKTAVDAVRTKTLRQFLHICVQLARDWRSQVLARRKPVPQQVMQRLYFLRMNRVEDYAAVERARTSALDWYRMRVRAPAAGEASVYVPLWEE